MLSFIKMRLSFYICKYTGLHLEFHWKQGFYIVLLSFLSHPFYTDLKAEAVYPQPIFNIRKVVLQDYLYKPYEEEGYFQGWNYVFYNKQYNLFITSLISNMGPGDKNHGIALSIKSEKTGSFFITKEYRFSSLEANRINYMVKNFNSSFEYLDSKYEIKVNADDVKVHLIFKNFKPGYTLSGERYFIKEGRFVRADIPFYNAEVEGYLDFKGDVIPLKGRGSMEHLLTNYEVYKYSSSWQIMRSQSKEGITFITGGFQGKSKMPGDYFRTFFLLDKNNNILLSGKVPKAEILRQEKDPYTGYLLPIAEKIFLTEDDSCFAKLESLESIGKINVLANISAFLRFFVNLFFANPYILAYSNKVTLVCPGVIPQEIELDGIDSQYLINPK
jgi:hypothetical protein